MDDTTTWKIIDTYFKDNPDFIAKHHLTSYNHFMLHDIPQIFKDNNPIRLVQEQGNVSVKIDIYIGGKNGDKVYYGKPTIYDKDRMHYMYPNEARLRNMMYAITIHYDVEVDIIFENKNGVIEKKEEVLLESVYLGRFPVMIKSKLCILNELSPEVCFNMGECINDPGGYFIIDGNEKVIISQEKFAANLINIKKNPNLIFKCSAEIYSSSEDASNIPRKLGIAIMSGDKKLTNHQISVFLPNVRKSIPLFILMRALGVISDKDIISTCLLDLKANADLIPLFIPSVHDAGGVFTQETAIKYIMGFIKGGTIHNTMNILCNYLLPHIGKTNYIEKAYFVGYVVYKMLMVYTGAEKETDRDSYKCKRIQLSGTLLSELFQEYYIQQQKDIRIRIDSEYNFNTGSYQDTNIKKLFIHKYFEQEKIVEQGFRKAFKGNWGSLEYTKKIGVVQELSRLSFNSMAASLVKTNLPLDSSAKVVGPHLLHTSQWGLLDPVDSPDGPNAGLHKHLAVSTVVSNGYSKFKIINLLKEMKFLIPITERHPVILYQLIKIFVNGHWCGCTDDPVVLVDKLRNYRRCGLIPPLTSISWNIRERNIYIYTDEGRPLRPVYYLEKGKIQHKDKLKKEFTWNQLYAGFSPKNNHYDTSIHSTSFYPVHKLYTSEEEAFQNKGLIEYLDSVESDTCMISFDKEDIKYSHMEIHGSLMFSLMGNQIILPEHNQGPRNIFSCGQSKQALSMFHTNYQNRMDTMSVVLHYGQLPIVKSRYLKYINNEQHPYGINAMIAIMCYSGYNVEDAVIINKAAIDRGLFNITYYSCYEGKEESENNSITEITNINNKIVAGTKAGIDYSHLDDRGLIKENTLIDNDKIALIGQTVSFKEKEGYMDASVFTGKGQEGYVDKSFITEGEGKRIAKVRIREYRKPEIGDKFVSRAAQKGTCGIILEEADMPYTANGMRPDIIINPHAMPTRMTIGQLVEMLYTKPHLEYGGFYDSTAFNSKGFKAESYGKILTKMGYHNSGTELMFNGMTGTPIEANIFTGPCYYLRLKQMVKDKINYRQLGPRTVMTRQPVQGRSNDGGIRMGEMERDGLAAYGMSRFMVDSMMKRSDDYSIAIDNTTGLIAAYNPHKNLFLSPMLDGPLQYVYHVDNDPSIVNVSKHKKTFSILKIPYAFKQLYYELLAINVQMRIITDDNIDTLESLSYSNNIKKIMSKPNEHISNVIQDIIKKSKTITPFINKQKEFKETKEKQEDENREFSLGDLVKYDQYIWEIKEIDKQNVLLENDDGTQVKTNIKRIQLHYVNIQIPPFVEFNVNDIVYFKNNLEKLYKVIHIVNHFNVNLQEINEEYPKQLDNVRIRRLILHEPFKVHDIVYVRDDIIMKPWLVEKIIDETTVQIKDKKSKVINVTVDKITRHKLYTSGQYKQLQEQALQQRLDSNIYLYDRVKLKGKEDVWFVDSIELHRDMNVYNLIQEKTYKASSALLSDLELVESCKFPKYSKIYLSNDNSKTIWTVDGFYTRDYKHGKYSIVNDKLEKKDVFPDQMIMYEMPPSSLRGGGYINTHKLDPTHKVDPTHMMMETFHHGGKTIQTVVTPESKPDNIQLGDIKTLVGSTDYKSEYMPLITNHDEDEKEDDVEIIDLDKLKEDKLKESEQKLNEDAVTIKSFDSLNKEDHGESNIKKAIVI